MWNEVEKVLTKKNMNQETLAKRAGIRSGIISDLKMGRIKKPSFELACKLADGLDVSVVELRNKSK